MKILNVETGGEAVAVVSGSEILIADVQSALDLMATVRYETALMFYESADKTIIFRGEMNV